jgi:hypothetical protein
VAGAGSAWRLVSDFGISSFTPLGCVAGGG